MFRQFRLTAANFQQSIHVDFDSAYMTVENPTGSPIFIRMGGRDFPQQSDADIIIPAGRDKSFSVTGHDFACVMASPSLVTGSTSSVISGLYQTATVTLYDSTEKIPAFGDATFLSLSISDMTNGFVAFTNGTQQVFDMRAWGGAIFAINPDTTADQGIVTIDVSSESTFATATQRSVMWTSAIWPGTPAQIIVPRVQGFMRITFTDSGIGAPAFTGRYAVRATIAEVLQPEFIPGTNTLSQVLNVPNLSTQSFVYCTVNLPAISFAVSCTGVNRNGEVVISTGDSAAGPWNTVSFREQVLQSSGIYHTIYESVGDLGAFTQISVLEVQNTGAIVGTIVASIRREPDLTGVLHQIYATLGDVAMPVNANQSIFALLGNIDVWVFNAQTYLSSLVTSIGVTLGADIAAIRTAIGTTLGVDLTAIRTALGAGNITTILNAISTTATAISTSIGAGVGTALSNIVSNTSLTASRALDIFNQATNILTSIGGSIGANVSSIATSLGAGLGTLVSTISTNIATLTTSLVGAQTRGSSVYGGTFNIAALGFQNIGTNIGAGTPAYIQAISLEWLVPSNGDPGIGMLQIAWGSNAAAVQTFYACVIDGKVTGKGPTLNTSSPRTVGVNMPANNVNFWVNSPIQPLQLSIVFYYST